MIPDDRPFHRAQPAQGKADPHRRLPEQGGLQGGHFGAAVRAGLLRPRLSADLGRSGHRHGGDGARRRPSRGHHRVGRLQHPRLSHPLAGFHRRGRPQQGAHRAEPHEARGVPAPALACRPVPLLRRDRQPPQQRGLRPVHRAQSRRRLAPLLGEAQLARPAPHCGVREEFLSHRHARPVHRHRPSRRPPLRRQSGRPHEGRRPARAAPLLRGGAGAAVRPPADPLDHVAEIVAVRARHPAGAIRFAGQRRRRRDGARAVDAAGKARLPLSR